VVAHKTHGKTCIGHPQEIVPTVHVYRFIYFLLSPPWGELEGALLSAPAHLLHTLHGAYLLDELLQF